MDNLIQWVQDHFNTLFSGLGVYIISLIIGVLCFLFFRSRSTANKVSQNNIVSGGDVVGRDKKGS